MILTDETHAYACTACIHTGQPCMEGLWLAQRVTRSLAARAGQLGEGFDLACTARFAGCGRACRTRVRARPEEVQIWCGLACDGGDRPDRDAAGPAAAAAFAAEIVARPIAAGRPAPALAAE